MRRPNFALKCHEKHALHADHAILEVAGPHFLLENRALVDFQRGNEHHDHCTLENRDGPKSPRVLKKNFQPSEKIFADSPR